MLKYYLCNVFSSFTGKYAAQKYTILHIFFQYQYSTHLVLYKVHTSTKWLVNPASVFFNILRIFCRIYLDHPVLGSKRLINNAET